MANLCDGESERVARWRQRNWDRDLRPVDVEGIINALMQVERENAALRAALADTQGGREQAVIEAARSYRETYFNRMRSAQEQISAQLALFDAVDALDAPPAGREGRE